MWQSELFPQTINFFNNLTELRFWCAKTQKIPEFIGKLTSLEKVNILADIIKLPESI